MKPFSGNKDIDRLILEKLDDEDLFKICIESGNKYMESVCNEDFWKNRTYTKFPETRNISKVEFKTWRTFYSQIVYYLTTYGVSLKGIVEAAVRGGMKDRDLIDFLILKRKRHGDEIISTVRESFAKYTRRDREI